MPRSKQMRIGLLVAALAVMAAVVLAVVLWPDGERGFALPSAESVEVREQGPGRDASLGSFPGDEAVNVAESEAAYSLSTPESMPDEDLRLVRIVLFERPDGSVWRATLVFTDGRDQPAKTLEISYLPPEGNYNVHDGGGNLPDSEELEINGARVTVSGTADGTLAGFGVEDQDLPMSIQTTGLPQDDILEMIREMLG